MPTRITIVRVSNGWVVEAGCLTLVFGTADELQKELASWLFTTKETEDRYREKYCQQADRAVDEQTVKQSSIGIGAINRIRY